MNIYVIRHGESEANVESFNEIKEDGLIELTQKGLNEAFVAGKLLKTQINENDYDESVIITRTYLRAMQTTGEIKKSLNFKTTSDARLVEFNRGLFKKYRFKERHLKYPKEFKEYNDMQHSPDKFFCKTTGR